MKNLDDLNTQKKQYLLFEIVAGSRAYGTHHAASDEDLRGIFMLLTSHYLLEESPLQQVSDERNDTVYYTLKRFLELAANANPNIIEMLFIPEDCVRRQSHLLQPLFDARHIFITQKVYSSHVNYAQAQIKKARGKNKWVNNPQPEVAPRREEFCWFISSSDQSRMPLRPVSLTKSGINLQEYHVSSVEHSSQLYRLYHYGKVASGVFHNDEIVCKPIPKDDEKSLCRGMLLFNENAYICAKRDHKHYWEWRANRNENRWLGQESGQRDYDAKNMMHTFRLLLSGQNILEHGEPLVRFEKENLELLLKIRDGKFTYDRLIEMVQAKLDSFAKIHALSKLPEEVDEEKLKDLLATITKNWEEENLREGTKE